MRSSYMGFGTGSLRRDFEDISACISYLLKNGKHLVVLMGHSTGSQNSVHYVLNRLEAVRSPAVGGVIVYFLLQR
jgi:pimeloyl-ACP methyl ester carboxylesterase